MSQTYQSARELMDAARDARQNAADEAYLERLAKGEVSTPVAGPRNAMLMRDMQGANRSASALRRHSLSPIGRRQARMAS